MENKRLEEIIRAGKARSISEAIAAAVEIEQPNSYLRLSPDKESLVWYQHNIYAGVTPRADLSRRRFETAWHLATGFYEEIEAPRYHFGNWRSVLRDHLGQAKASLDKDRLEADCPICGYLGSVWSEGEHKEHGNDVIQCHHCNAHILVRW